MKDFWKSGILILIIIVIGYIIFLRECKKPIPCPAEGEMIISKSIWNEITALANKPPEIKIDTFYIKGENIYINNPLPVPVPDSQDSTINNYADSLVNKEISVWIDLRLRGELLDRSWRYSPITTQIVQETKIYVPQIIEKPIPVSQRSLYLYGLAGGNMDSFLFGGGLDLITKKENMYGFQYQRFGDKNFYSLKIGAKIRLRK